MHTGPDYHPGRFYITGNEIPLLHTIQITQQNRLTLL